MASLESVAARRAARGMVPYEAALAYMAENGLMPLRIRYGNGDAHDGGVDAHARNGRRDDK